MGGSEGWGRDELMGGGWRGDRLGEGLIEGE